MDALATYIEKRIRIQRRFDLYPDRIHIEGRQRPGGRFETEYYLNSIRLPKSTVWIQDSFRQGLYGLPFGLALLGVVGYGPSLYSYSPILFWLVVCILFGAMVASFIFAKRTKYYQYSTDAGVPVLNIGAIGNTEDELDKFSTLLDRQVEKSKQCEHK